MWILKTIDLSLNYFLYRTHVNLKSEFEDLKAKDPAFNKNPEAQLDWIYKHSDYYEKAHLNYPVYRIL